MVVSRSRASTMPRLACTCGVHVQNSTPVRGEGTEKSRDPRYRSVLSPFLFFYGIMRYPYFFLRIFIFCFSLFVFSPSRFIVNSTLLLALFFPLFLFSLIFLFSLSLSLKDKSRRKSDPRPRFYNIAAYRWCRILKTRVGFCRVAFRRSCIIRSAP